MIGEDINICVYIYIYKSPEGASNTFHVIIRVFNTVEIQQVSREHRTNVA